MNRPLDIATVFIAGLITETNTLSPLPTGYRNYTETALFHGDATQHPPRGGSGILHRWREIGEKRGMFVEESLCTMAQPAGPTRHSVYEQFATEILTDLKAAMPVDMVLLSLHGAMVSTHCDDCEGDILERIRSVVGGTCPIGVELDPHCHLSEQMLANSSVIVTYKEYPHTDQCERAEEAFELCDRTRIGEILPTSSVYDCKMVNIFQTTHEPMRGFVQRMKDLELKESVLSVSLVHGFPWGDVADNGTKVLVVTDAAQSMGDKIARKLGSELWSIRERTRLPCISTGDALDAVRQSGNGPVVIADLADNAGGGAPGDNTFVLGELLTRQMTNILLSSIWDPGAVRLCFEAGEGANFNLRIGGKCGPSSGQPLDLQVTVQGLRPNYVQMSGDTAVELGDSALVSCAGALVILNSIRTQTLGLDIITGFDIDPLKLDAIIVKSMHHFHAAFAPIASQIIYVSAPGALSVEFERFVYEKKKGKFWPRDLDPFEYVRSA